MKYVNEISEKVCTPLEPLMQFLRGAFDIRNPWVKDIDIEEIQHHTIVIDHSGMILPFTEKKIPLRSKFRPSYFNQSKRQLSDAQGRNYLEKIMDNIEKTRDQFPNGVTIIVHGGNQRPRKSIQNAAKLLPKIKKDKYYPIFIIWDSWPVGAYFEQLSLVRSGRYSQVAPISAPFYFISDILMAGAHLIPTLFTQMKQWWRRSCFYDYPSTKNLEGFNEPPPNVKLKIDKHRPSCTPLWQLVLNIVLVTVLFASAIILALRHSPVALVFSILLLIPIIRFLLATIITVAALRTWENLLRRAKAMFRAPREIDRNVLPPEYHPPDGESFSPPEGAMAVFLRLFSDLAQTSDRERNPIKVILIAHSMGSMITNEFIQRLDCDLNFDSIVYMAAACSVREFKNAVIPILRRNATTHAYLLNLHPKVEAGERMGAGFLPRGSILEWLEGFLDPPNTHLDRILGKWDNVVRALHIFEDEVRDRIHIRAFPYSGEDWEKKLCKHVHFNDPSVPFWRKDSWQ